MTDTSATHASRAVIAVTLVAATCAALVAVMAPSVYRPRSPWPNEPGYYVSVFMLAQVAGVAALLGVLRLLGRPVGAPLDQHRLRLVVNSCIVAVAAMVPVLAEMTVTAALNRDSAPGIWYPLLIGAVSIGALLVSVAAVVLIYSTLALRVALWPPAPRPSAPADAAPNDLLGDVAGTLQTLREWTSRHAPRMIPLVDAVVAATVRAAHRTDRRLPWLRAWLDIRAHPWRFCAVVAVVCGAGLALPDAIVKGEIEGPAAVFEIAAVLTGFAFLGGYLGIRPTALRATRSTPPR
jgi:hypothetical protein